VGEVVWWLCELEEWCIGAVELRMVHVLVAAARRQQTRADSRFSPFLRRTPFFNEEEGNILRLKRFCRYFSRLSLNIGGPLSHARKTCSLPLNSCDHASKCHAPPVYKR